MDISVGVNQFQGNYREMSWCWVLRPRVTWVTWNVLMKTFPIVLSGPTVPPPELELSQTASYFPWNLNKLPIDYHFYYPGRAVSQYKSEFDYKFISILLLLCFELSTDMISDISNNTNQPEHKKTGLWTLLKLGI